MKIKKLSILGLTLFVASTMLVACCGTCDKPSGKWVKYEKNPVLGGGNLGTIFDISVLKTDKGYTMFSSWRPERGIAVHYSKDGYEWTLPKLVFKPQSDKSNWEYRINRPGVIFKDGYYHMWYTGQTGTKPLRSRIGYAKSKDGVNWERHNTFVMESTEKWEGLSLMCPHVIWDEQEKIFKMWYSGGETYEPNAIGYATSKDGINWTKYSGNPVCVPDKKYKWEQDRVTACQVIKRENDYLMFYIGFEDIHTARICMARSKDGITNWERFSGNPIIQPDFSQPDSWDASATYKPYVIFDGEKWIMWYNGRIHKLGLERIGVATYYGKDLGF